MKKPFYELAVFGDVPPDRAKQIRAEIDARVKDLGLSQPSDVSVFVGSPAEFTRQTDRCGAALCFPIRPTDEASVLALMSKGLSVIPITEIKDDLAGSFSERIGALNGVGVDKDGIDGAVIALLECASMLPRQRRVFLSYRRSESTQAALQLYAELSGRLFDVFLDTHDILPGKHFQEVLWQKLCDCDVVLFLDTEKYFESRWTQAEFGNAMWRGISFVRAGWPGISINPRAQLATSVQLSNVDFDPTGTLLSPAALERLCNEVEQARTRSVAARYTQLISTLRESVRRSGGSIEGMSLRRSVIVKVRNGKRIAVYPALGVPTSYTLFDATRDSHTPPVAVVYDEGGIEEREWKAHMEWVSHHVRPAVRLVKGYTAGIDFNDWN